MKSLTRLIACAVLFSTLSCTTDFLDIKPDIRQRIPKTLTDYMALLDNTDAMNASSHALGIIGSDEFYMTEAGYHSFPQGVNYNYQKRAYTWEQQIFQGGEAALLDWNDAYFRILCANVVLDGIARISLAPGDSQMASIIRGRALFYRAFNYYCLAQLFCKAYTTEGAAQDLGLPLRLDGDLTAKIGRSRLEETYQRILDDLQEAESLLPPISEMSFRPSKAAVYALRARAKLQMGDYNGAYNAANSCLEINDRLLDYNSLDLDEAVTFSAYGEGNPEVIFMATCVANTTFLLLPTFHYMNADTNLLACYAADDLRLRAFWTGRENGTYQYKGSYDGSIILSFFTGLAVDEIYLMRAECAARMGNAAGALADLNLLRKHRLRTEAFANLETTDSQQALDWVVEERRKQLVLRGTRWEDLKRLNKVERYQKVLRRDLGTLQPVLEPGDSRYVWPIPIEAIEMGGYEQNLR